jgi:3-hydroxypropanoate dehydrogenase
MPNVVSESSSGKLKKRKFHDYISNSTTLSGRVRSHLSRAKHPFGLASSNRRTAVLRQIYDLAKFPPTRANGQPARFVSLTTPDSKARLPPLLAPTNVEKTRTAPVTAIIAWDNEFYEKLPKLLPHTDAARWFRGNGPLIVETVMRNGSLGGAYFIMTSRALGIDCGPMSGFDAEK